MYVDKLYIDQNMVTNRGVMTYLYQINPVSSIYSEKNQQYQLLETLFDLITNINMQGFLMIRPHRIRNQKIYKYYIDNYQKHGKKSPQMKQKAKDMVLSLQKIMNQTKSKYRYDIILAFCDGREELKKKKLFYRFLDLEENKPYSKEMMDNFRLLENEIYKKIALQGLDVKRMDEEEIRKLYQYIAIPQEEQLQDYYIEPKPEHLIYHYQLAGAAEMKKQYCRTYAASKFERLEEKGSTADTVFNHLQLEGFPTDIFVKFDIAHTKEFRQNMRGKKVEIEKKQRLYENSADMDDIEGKKAKALALVGEKQDEAIERCKLRWQLFLRIRSATEKDLNRYGDALRRRLSVSSIVISNEFGDQEKLAENLFPNNTVFVKYVQTTDLSYFTQFNWLGGLSIGEAKENEGFVITYTSPGQIPVIADFRNVFTVDKAATNAPTVLFSGETGSGKTQLAFSIAFQYLIFRNVRTLTIDPKGDRAKKIDYWGEDAAHLRIGSKECPNGMFDAYLIHEDIGNALDQAKRDIDALALVVKVEKLVSFKQIEEAHAQMICDYQNHLCKRMTFTYLLQKLRNLNERVADEILTLRNDQMGRLFFADESTQFDAGFNLNKLYNLITFEKTPAIAAVPEGQKDPNQFDKIIFSVVLSRVREIVNSFMRRYQNEEKILICDEYKVWKGVPGGEQIIEDINRQCRSWLTLLFILTQSPSDVSNGIIENTGQFFIGSIRSNEEIDFIIQELHLQDNAAIRSALMDRTKSEGVNKEKKYRFVYVDYNGRKCVTRLEIPEVFDDIFKTMHLNEKAGSSKKIHYDTEDELKKEVDAFIADGDAG